MRSIRVKKAFILNSEIAGFLRIISLWIPMAHILWRLTQAFLACGGARFAKCGYLTIAKYVLDAVRKSRDLKI